WTTSRDQSRQSTREGCLEPLIGINGEHPTRVQTPSFRNENFEPFSLVAVSLCACAIIPRNPSIHDWVKIFQQIRYELSIVTERKHRKHLLAGSPPGPLSTSGMGEVG